MPEQLCEEFLILPTRVGKRSITETEIGEGAVSVSYAAIQVVEKIFANLQNRSAIVIGAGETGKVVALHLKDKGIGKIAIANRTLIRAEELAEKVQGEIVPFEICTNSFTILI